MFLENIILLKIFFVAILMTKYCGEECINLFLKTLKKSGKNIRNIFKLWTLKFPPKIWEISNLGLESFHFLGFFQSGYFYFSSSQSYFLQYKKKFHFEKYKNFFNLEATSSISWNMKDFNLRARKFHFLNYKRFLRVELFLIFRAWT